MRLSPEQVVALEFRDATRKEEYRRLAKHDLAAAPRLPQPENHRYSCGGGVNGCAVDPVGNMTICVISHQQSYNIREGSFQQGWDGRLHEIRTQPRTRATICDGCRIQSLCSMCPANGELENGDPESPVDFLCQVAHLRAYTLGYAVPGHDTEHDSCPNCAGGRNHTALLEAADRVEQQKSEINILLEGQPASSLPSALNVLQPVTGCRTGGCNACATVHA